MSPQSPFTRRSFLGSVSALAATTVAVPAAEAAVVPAATSSGGEVPLHWLDGRPAASVGCAFGVPWPRGALSRNVPLALHGGDGAPVPVRASPLGGEDRPVRPRLQPRTVQDDLLPRHSLGG